MWRKLKITLEMIKFEHTIFALPFALISVVLATTGWPDWRKLGWILLAMVGARSAAMAFNRIVDRHYDLENPRTRLRALPANLVSLAYVVGFTLASSLLFIVAAWMLNRLCFWLSFPVLAILFFYSYTKRFTNYSHLVLGLCLGLAPPGAWIAIRGDLHAVPLLLCLIVMLWTAGFDLIYACQDVEFDRQKKLFSLPRRFGISTALRISTFWHLCMVLLLFWLVYLAGLGWIATVGVAAVALLLWYEHRLVRPDDLSRVNAAFFTVNGFISLLLLFAISLDKWF